MSGLEKLFAGNPKTERREEYPDGMVTPDVAPVMPTPEVSRRERPAAEWDGSFYDELRDKQRNPTVKERKPTIH